MDLNIYYKRKRRRAAIFKLGIFFLISFSASVAVWGLSDVFNMASVKQVFIKKEEQVKALPWMIFCSGQNECFYVDGKGVLAEEAPNFSANPLPELVLPGNFNKGDRILSPANNAFLKVFLIQLQNINGAVKKIEILENQEVKLFFQEGWFLLASFELQPEQIAQDLKLLLDQKIGVERARLEYIDLRFPDKAFYKLRN